MQFRNIRVSDIVNSAVPSSLHYNLQFVTICNFSDRVGSTRVYANSCYYDGSKATGMRKKQVDFLFCIFLMYTYIFTLYLNI